MLRSLARQLGSFTSQDHRLIGGALCSAALLAPQTCPAAQPWLLPPFASQQVAWYSTESFTKLLHNAGPRSLQFQRQPAEELASEARRGLAVKAFLMLGGYYSRESQHMRAAKRLYEAVKEQAVAPSFLQAMGIPSAFQQQHSSLCLHVWLLLVRLRAEGKDGKSLAQVLYDDFQTDVEERARAAGVRVRLAKQLTELEKQFYGSSMSYDRAMAGEEALDRALHRNVYLLQPGYEHSAQLLARYVRRELACLTMTPSEAVMAGNIKFTSDGLEEDVATSGSGADAMEPAAAGDGSKQEAPVA